MDSVQSSGSGSITRYEFVGDNGYDVLKSKCIYGRLLREWILAQVVSGSKDKLGVIHVEDELEAPLCSDSLAGALLAALLDARTDDDNDGGSIAISLAAGYPNN
jgi:hypothetical protein